MKRTQNIILSLLSLLVISCTKDNAIPLQVIDSLPLLSKALPGYEFDKRAPYRLIRCGNIKSIGVGASAIESLVFACSADESLPTVASALQEISKTSERPEIMLLAKCPKGKLFRLPFRYPTVDTSNRPTIRLYIDTEGYLRENRPISRLALADVIRNATQVSPDSKVAVSWHPDARYQQLFEVVEVCAAMKVGELFLDASSSSIDFPTPRTESLGRN